MKKPAMQRVAYRTVALLPLQWPALVGVISLGPGACQGNSIPIQYVFYHKTIWPRNMGVRTTPYETAQAIGVFCVVA